MNQPQKFRKKPVEIEACQFLGDRDSMESWIGRNEGVSGNWFFDGNRYTSFNIVTLEGVMTAVYGDWIIKGVQGEFYPCKPDIFEATYTEVI